MSPDNFNPVKEEPSYMMFARANVRDGISTSPLVVQELLARIDRLEADKVSVSEYADDLEHTHKFIPDGVQPKGWLNMTCTCGLQMIVPS